MQNTACLCIAFNKIRISNKMKTFWYLWVKALGEKAHEDRATSDKVALIRTGIVLVYIITNFFIVANILKGWLK